MSAALTQVTANKSKNDVCKSEEAGKASEQLVEDLMRCEASQKRDRMIERAKLGIYADYFALPPLNLIADSFEADLPAIAFSAALGKYTHNVAF